MDKIPNFYARTGPNCIEAIQFTAENIADVREFCSGNDSKIVTVDSPFSPSNPLEEHKDIQIAYLVSMRGSVYINEGDYLVKDLKDHLFVLTAKQFAENYTKV